MSHDLVVLLLTLAGLAEYPGRYLAGVNPHGPAPVAHRARLIHGGIAAATVLAGALLGGLTWGSAMLLSLWMAGLLSLRYALLLMTRTPRFAAEVGVLALFTVVGAGIVRGDAPGVDLGALGPAVRQLAGLLVAAGAGTGFTRLALDALSLTSDAGAPAPSPPEGDQPAADDADELRAGRVIGIFERALVFGLAQATAYSAIGFVLTAKSITRFKALEQRRFAEYYLVGTLSSLAWALGCSAITHLGARFEPVVLGLLSGVQY